MTPDAEMPTPVVVQKYGGTSVAYYYNFIRTVEIRVCRIPF